MAAGSIGANKNKNHSVYGRDVSYASILSGGVPPPDELASLYKRLNDMVEVSTEMHICNFRDL